MKKNFIILILGLFSCFFAAAQTPIFTIASGTDHVIKSGTVVSMDGLVLTPSKDFSLSGKSLTRKPTASNTATNPNISNYYAFNGTTNAFTGLVNFNYSDTELNGLTESALKLNIFIPSTWVLQSGGTINTTSNYVQNTLAAISMKELTLGSAACVKPTAPAVSVTQPTCAVSTGTVTVTSTKTGLLFSVDGINYSNSTGIFAGLASGVYSVSAKNSGGCISNATLATVNAKPLATAATASLPTQTVCTGVAITAINLTDANKVTGTSFSWTRTNTTSLTGIAASGTGASITGTLINATTVPQLTVFTITATAAGGCSSTTTASVTVNPKPSITAQPANTSKTVGQTATFSITAAGLITSYQWQQSTNAGSTYSNITNGGIYSGANSSTLYLTGVTAIMTNYRYRCIATGQCSPAVTSNAATLTVTKTSTSTIVARASGITATQDSVSIKGIGLQAYPNPTSGQFNLAISNFTYGKAMVKITDVTGRTILLKEVQIGAAKQVVAINISNAIPGSYFVQAVQPDHTASLLLIKE